MTNVLLEKKGHIAVATINRPKALNAMNSQVLEDIDNVRSAGTVKVDGKIWTARSAGGDPIPAGTEVTIQAIEGVKVLVTPAR